MKPITFFFSTILTSFIFMSCSNNAGGGLDMTNAENADKIQKSVLQLTKDYSDILSIRLNSDSDSENFSNNMGGLFVLAKDGNERVSYATSDLESGLEEFKRSELTTLDKRMKVIDPAKIDYQAIAANIEAAKQSFPEGVVFEGIGDYKFTNTSGFVQHSFVLEVTEEGNRTERSGQTTNIVYYKLNFETDTEGNVILLD